MQLKFCWRNQNIYNKYRYFSYYSKYVISNLRLIWILNLAFKGRELTDATGNSPSVRNSFLVPIESSQINFKAFLGWNRAQGQYKTT